MKSVNIHKAKTHLSSLVDKVAESGEAFVFAKAGKSVAKVVPIDASDDKKIRRLGFLEGQVDIPNDFDSMGDSEIQSDSTGEVSFRYLRIVMCCLCCE